MIIQPVAEQAAEALRREQEALQRAQLAEAAHDAAAADAASAKQQAVVAHEQLTAAKTKAKADLKVHVTHPQSKWLACHRGI